MTPEIKTRTLYVEAVAVTLIVCIITLALTLWSNAHV